MARKPCGPKGEELHILVRLVSQSFQQQMEEQTAAYGVSFSQWRVIGQLEHNGGRCQGDLARLLGIAEATLTHSLRRLEKKQLVARRRNMDNRREILVFLTARGRALHQALVPAMQDVQARASSAVADNELAVLKTLLRQLIDKLER